MARMRTCVGGIALLAVTSVSAPVGAQDLRFEVAAGVQFGVQDPERPVTPGWVLSAAFEARGQEVVVEGAWHRQTYPWLLRGAEAVPRRARSRHAHRRR